MAACADPDRAGQSRAGQPVPGQGGAELRMTADARAGRSELLGGSQRPGAVVGVPGIMPRIQSAAMAINCFSGFVR